MFDQDASLTALAVVDDGAVEPLALEVVLDGASPLHWRVNANADDAEAEEEEHGRPLQHCHARALSLHLRHPLVPTVLAGDLLGLFTRPLLLDLLEGYRLVLDVSQVNLLHWRVLSVWDLLSRDLRWHARDLVVDRGAN